MGEGKEGKLARGERDGKKEIGKDRKRKFKKEKEIYFWNLKLRKQQQFLLIDSIIKWAKNKRGKGKRVKN